jgi:hypothetical protein
MKICSCKFYNRKSEFVDGKQHQLKDKCSVNHMTLDTKGKYILKNCSKNTLMFCSGKFQLT